MEIQDKPYTDYESLFLPPQFAAESLGLTTRTLKLIEEENGLEIHRVPRGSVSARMYLVSDLFQMAAIRRAKGATKGLAHPITLSTFVQKGGTGKTTCSVNLAIYLSLAGLRTLLIDNDPQGDATTMLGYDPDLFPEELEEMGIPGSRAIDGCLSNLLGMGGISPLKTLDEVIKKPFGEYGPHLIPAEPTLTSLDLALNAANNPDFRYAAFIQKARSGQIEHCDLSGYDVIIFDNAPSGSRLTRNTVVASDMLLCPVRMDKFSFRALTRLANDLVEFEQDFNRSVGICALPTMFIKNRPRILNNVAKLSDMLPGCVTDSRIYHSEDFSKALEESIPLLLWRGASDSSAGAMRRAFAEILERLRSIGSK
ncbi:Cellulose biosynthesis protein BcsQ [Azotobacter beijerinckii]|uniref:Cellulose biosynthesis protein BcsQ n=1 Tax=Azotobacter beijerinckii TaxID=170623 RepID=A0A1H6ZZV3_9GAMM|nr:AAA family ATPase [Azotobacter beijerinckii]SEJ55110.1 Cellulose biosynthesis protein BcsQ [Azotobacter beijerinckii]SER93603.1 Cellulose biosynthesis protein BcsQ [Azotobacter beijerinckii]